MLPHSKRSVKGELALRRAPLLGPPDEHAGAVLGVLARPLPKGLENADSNET